jgi:alpha-tubulin suppressor-like RCC1 family protein
MFNVLKIRQRRFAKVQMQSTTDREGEPCLLTAENNKNNGSVFGPYLTTCPTGEQGRGCYDIQMTTRKVRILEFQSCMQTASSDQLWQCGNQYECLMAIDDFERNYLDDNSAEFKWCQANVNGVPKDVVACSFGSTSGSFSENPWICIIVQNNDNKNVVFCRGENLLCNRGNDSVPTGGWWAKCATRYKYRDDPEYYYDVTPTKIVGQLEAGKFIVLDNKGYPWVIRLYEDYLDIETSYNYIWPVTVTGESSQENPVVFMSSTRNYMSDNPGTEKVIWVTQAEPHILRLGNADISGNSIILGTHPNGKSFIDGAINRFDSAIGIDEDGKVWVIGDNSYSILGFPTENDGGYDYINDLTLLDSITNKIIKVEMGDTNAFLISDSGMCYSSGGSYNESTYISHMLGRKSSLLKNTFSHIKGRWKKISVADNHVYAIYIDNTLWFWGNPESPNMGLQYTYFGPTPDWNGIGKDIGSESIKDNPFLISESNDWVTVTAHPEGGSGIKRCSGDIGLPVIAGDENIGQQGGGGPEFMPLEMPYEANIIDMAISHKFALYVNEINMVYAYGDFSDNPLGGYVDGYVEFHFVEEMVDVLRVWAVGNNTAYYDKNGFFYITGNDVAVIGPNENYGYTEFQEIKFDFPVKDVRITIGYGVYVLLNSGDLYVWGWNGEHQLGIESPEWIGEPTKVAGRYSSISATFEVAAGISITGRLIMWGYDSGIGFFGQHINCSTFDSEDTPDMLLTTPTLIRPDCPAYMNESPSIFKDVEISNSATYIIIGETDDNWEQDPLFDFESPRWCIGDVWVTGNPKLSLYEHITNFGCWGVIIAGKGCYERPCVESDKTFNDLNKMKLYFWDYAKDDPTYWGEGSLYHNVDGQTEPYLPEANTITCPFFMIRIIVSPRSIDKSIRFWCDEIEEFGAPHSGVVFVYGYDVLSGENIEIFTLDDRHIVINIPASNVELDVIFWLFNTAAAEAVQPEERWGGYWMKDGLWSEGDPFP